MKNILIELPNWIGDAVMATMAIENIVQNINNCELVVIGSKASIEIFRYHPKVKKLTINDSKNKKLRYIYLYKLAKSLGKFDIAISFRRSFSSKFFIFFVNSKKKYSYKRDKKDIHLSLIYKNFINRCLKLEDKVNSLKIYTSTYLTKQKTLRAIVGINGGATYGKAKRWDEEKFAIVASYLSKFFDIIIFGNKNETEMAKKIEDKLKDLGVRNFINLSGKTSVEGLINYISKLSLFITNDSGPMHIASAFNIPTVAIFGPTNIKETYPFSKNSIVLQKDYDCIPCMKRECPLIGDEYHKCMKNIEVNEVLEKISEVLQKGNI